MRKIEKRKAYFFAEEKTRRQERVKQERSGGK